MQKSWAGGVGCWHTFGTTSLKHPFTYHSKLVSKKSKREIHYWWLPIEPRWLHKPKDIQSCKKKNLSLLFVTQATYNHQNFSSKCQDQSCRGNKVNQSNCFHTEVAGRGQMLLYFFSKPFSWEGVWGFHSFKSNGAPQAGNPHWELGEESRGHCGLGNYNFPPGLPFLLKEELGFLMIPFLVTSFQLPH